MSVKRCLFSYHWSGDNQMVARMDNEIGMFNSNSNSLFCSFHTTALGKRNELTA